LVISGEHEKEKFTNCFGELIRENLNIFLVVVACEAGKFIDPSVAYDVAQAISIHFGFTW
jgi:hypothetical protein